MSENEIFEKLKKIIVEELGSKEEDVTLDATFVDDLSADSLDIVELVMCLEEEFGIDIPDSTAEKITTVRDVVDYIQKEKSK